MGVMAGGALAGGVLAAGALAKGVLAGGLGLGLIHHQLNPFGTESVPKHQEGYHDQW